MTLFSVAWVIGHILGIYACKTFGIYGLEGIALCIVMSMGLYSVAEFTK